MYFWFVLALSLHTSVADLQQRMSAAEFSYWIAFYEARPFGPQWDDVRSAVATAHTVSPHVRNRVKIEDFLAFRPRKKQSVEEICTTLESIFADLRVPVANPDNEERRQNYERAKAEAAKAVTHG